MKAQSLLEEIKARIDIVDFISDYVQLKKSGQNYKGLCPFHSEKTASFMVSQSKQIFHCFGCGMGGDVVSFLMKHDNLSFNEATRYIAKKAGIQMTDTRFNKDVIENREKLLHLQAEAMKFFEENLGSSGSARAYLKNRGINEISVSSFHIGYATNDRDALLRHLRKKGFPDSLIKDAGLAVADERGYRDIFRGRIIFPIFNLKNDVIAFGGRVMDDSLPKYLNTPETGIFKKGEALFAINLSKDEIRKKGDAVIVEGYLDAIVCHQHGFKNTVAPLGTALTIRQLQRLKLLTGKVVVVFDGDKAGISAARRSLAVLCECDLRARVLLLPEDDDPDSFLRKKGSQHFKKMLTNTMSMIEFLLNISEADNVDNVREALGMIAAVKDFIVADEMLGELADRCGINEPVLRSELKKIRKKTCSQNVGGLKAVNSTLNREESLLLSAIIAFPEKTDGVLSRLNIEDLKDGTIISILNKVKRCGGNLNINSLLSQSDDAERALVTELSLTPGFDLEHVDRNIDDCLHRLAQRRFEEKRRLVLTRKPDDAALHDSLLKEKRRLIKGVHP